jgi:hypothetical protein
VAKGEKNLGDFLPDFAGWYGGSSPLPVGRPQRTRLCHPHKCQALPAGLLRPELEAPRSGRPDEQRFRRLAERLPRLAACVLVFGGTCRKTEPTEQIEAAGELPPPGRGRHRPCSAPAPGLRAGGSCPFLGPQTASAMETPHHVICFLASVFEILF